MSDAAAQKRGGISPETIERVDEFEALYAKWLALRASLVAGIDDDDLWNAQSDNLDAVELQLLFTPSPIMRVFWVKWDILALAIDVEDRNGMEDPDRVIRALAGVKADLARLKFANE